ncbi:hypothetical protein POUND7_016735 [Theobroma cacao]
MSGVLIQVRIQARQVLEFFLKAWSTTCFRSSSSALTNTKGHPLSLRTRRSWESKPDEYFPISLHKYCSHESHTEGQYASL